MLAMCRAMAARWRSLSWQRAGRLRVLPDRPGLVAARRTPRTALRLAYRVMNMISVYRA
jgi:hypothetical protein